MKTLAAAALLAVLLAGTAVADCPGGVCKVAKKATVTATRGTVRVAAAPVRVVRRVFGR
jgi:hypothetical protein